MKNDKTKKDFINRLSYIEGHCRAVKRMVDENKYCIDIIHQIEAVEAGLRKIKEKILKDHLDTCVTTAIRGSNGKAREKVLGELLEVYKKNNHD